MPELEQPPVRVVAPEGLVPSLGPFITTMFVVGAVIGSGIFRKSGVMAGQLGSAQLLMGVWVLAGIITLVGALINAEIAGMIPETGGQYVYFDRMYGPFAAHLYGWAVFAVIQTGSIASLAMVFAEHAAQFVALPELSPSAAAFSLHLPFIGDIRPFAEFGVKSLAAVLIIGLTAVNYLGVKLGGVVQTIFALAKISGMAALVLLVFLLPDIGHAANFASRSSTLHLDGLAWWAAIAAALQGAFWAYDGWNSITYISGEVKNPQRNIPRALIFGTGIVIAAYLLMNAAYIYLFSIDEMAASKLVAADAADRCFAGGGRWIAAVVMVSTFGATNGYIMSSARVYFSMARRNVFPKILGVAHPRFHTPSASLIVQCLWCLLLLLSGTFDTLTDMLIFVSWIFYAAGAYGLFVLRRREPATPRPYRVPGYPLLPWLFIASALLFLVLTIYNDISHYQAAVAQGKPAIINCAFGTVLVLLGVPIYLYYRSAKKAQS